MKGLVVAAGIRRRQLERLRLALAERQQQLSTLQTASADEHAARERERRLARHASLPADAWFEKSARQLAGLAEQSRAVEAELASLSGAALDARARLSLLEEAEAAARLAARRQRDRQLEAMLDDRTAALWSQR